MERPSGESLRVVFVSDRKARDLDELYCGVVALANTEGGCVCLGVEPDGTITGADPRHTDLGAMTALIKSHVVSCDDLRLILEHWDGREVLVAEISSRGPLAMTSDGRYLRRCLSDDGIPETVPMLPADLVRRLGNSGSFDYSGLTASSLSTGEAFAPLETERLRSMIRTLHGDQSLLALDDGELCRELGLVRDVCGNLQPTVAGILLLGREEVIRSHVPGHEVLFQVFAGDRVIVNGAAMHGSLLRIFEDVSLRFQSFVSEDEININMFRVPLPDFDKYAFHEGFVNALTHRDYLRCEPVYVQMQLSGGELIISSPGGFPAWITPSSVLSAHPTPRNIVLADAARRIGYGAGKGLGIKRVYETMLRGGHEFPDYSGSNRAKVQLRLYGGAADRQFVCLLINEDVKVREVLSLDVLIILSYLRRFPRAELAELAAVIQKSEFAATLALEWLAVHGLVKVSGTGARRRFRLDPAKYPVPAEEETMFRKRVEKTLLEMDRILGLIAEKGRISRSETTRLCGCSADHAYYLLSELVRDGRIRMLKGGRNACYALDAKCAQVMQQC